MTRLLLLAPAMIVGAWSEEEDERESLYYTFRISDSTAEITFHGTGEDENAVEFPAEPDSSSVQVTTFDDRGKVKYSIECTRSYWQRHGQFERVKWKRKSVPCAYEFSIPSDETQFIHEGLSADLDGNGNVTDVYWGQTRARMWAGRVSRALTWRALKPGTKFNPTDEIKVIVFNVSPVRIPTEGRELNESKEPAPP